MPRISVHTIKSSIRFVASSVNTGTSYEIIVPSILGPTLMILCLLLSILVPMIIVNNRRKRSHRPSHKVDSEQLGSTTRNEPVEGTNDPVIDRASQNMEHEIEMPGNHLYDELMNYKDEDNLKVDSPTQINSNVNAEPQVGVEETDHILSTEEREGLHTYAVLEEAIPPVPERTYRKNTHVVKKQPVQLPVLKEESNISERSSQRSGRGRPHSINNMTDEPETPANGRKSTHAMPEKKMDLSGPSQHTHAVLEPPMLPLRRHKTQSAAARKKMVSNRVKRFSDATHGVKYDGLGLKTEGRLRKTSAHVMMMTTRPAEDDESEIHQYAVLEGPIPVIEQKEHGILQGIKNSAQTSRTTTGHSGTTSSTYDRLAPKTADNSTENTEFTHSRPSHLLTGGQKSTLISKHDRFSQRNESAGPRETGHTYDTLEPKNESIKPKSTKRNSKKKKQPPINQDVESSHIYDILEFSNEVEGCEEEQRWQESRIPPSPSDAMKRSLAGSRSSDRKVSCEGVSIDMARKRKLTHSLSSRTICDVSEARTRATTVFSVASDTNLNRIHTDSEAHIYDTVEVFPVSQRKRKRSGKRYRWLHLKEQLQKQSTVDHPHNSNTVTPTTSGYMTEAPGMTTSSSVSSVNTPATQLPDPNTPAEVYEYASLDKTQTYTQVGPFIPSNRKESTEQLQPAIEEGSEYAHLKHHYSMV